MRIFYFLILTIFLSNANALSVNMTWTDGQQAGPLNNGINTTPVYDAKGVASQTAYPGSRSGAATWTDNAGNLWLFGGKSDLAGITSYRNDLWKYDRTNKTWTWVSGNSTTNAIGTYGQQGIGSELNVPGAKFGASTWSDSTGKLWLFGGYTYSAPDQSSFIGDSNDLWFYNTVTGYWTWVRGGIVSNRAGVYGTMNVGTSLTIPPARSGASSWNYSNGSFGLFAGSLKNDLWIYNPQTNIWTWKKGYNTSEFKSGIYGTRGVPESYTTPGVRNDAIVWVDNYDTVWMFGGYGHASSGSAGYLNDLWRYNPNSNQWTWMHGYAVINEPGNYVSLGLEALTTMPGARQGAISWIDNSGTLWLFGGYGCTEQDGEFGDLNDVWSYRPKVNSWSWQKGSNYNSSAWNGAGKYGTIEVESANNISPGKSNTSSWKVNKQLTYFYGGDTNLAYNFKQQTEDFWKINTISGSPDNSNSTPPTDDPPPPVAAPTNLSVTFTSPSGANLTWQDNSSNETVFKVYRKSSTENTFSLIATLPANTLVFTDSGLTSNITYFYRVEAVNTTTGQKGISEVVSVSTFTLSSPTNIRYQYIKPSTVRIDWNHDGSNQIQYRILRDEIGSQNGPVQIALLTPFSTQYTDNSVSQNKVYTYFIEVEHISSGTKYRSIGITVSTFPNIVVGTYDLSLENINLLPKLKANKKSKTIKGAGQILGTVDIVNNGTKDSVSTKLQMFLSYSPTPSGTILLNLNEISVPVVSDSGTEKVSPGFSETVQKNGKITKKVVKFKIPSNTSYKGLYLHLVLDKQKATEDTNFNNNVISLSVEGMIN